MSARRASARKGRTGTGCLQNAAIVFFALVLGAFAASTWMRHVNEQNSSRVESPRDSLSSPPVERARIRVEVRNGSGVAGAAADVTEYLREAGFDVVDFGNASEFDQPQTVVIDRVGVPGPAREVAAVLRGVPIRLGIDTTLYLDVTVLVGRDAPELLAGRVNDGEGGWRRWLRRMRELLP